MRPNAVSKVVITTATAHPRELRTAAQLRALLQAYDVSGLQWTSRVRVEHQGVASAHPVLVLTTRHQGDDLLATYVHQQLHRWTAGHPGLGGAITDTARTWAVVPTTPGGGANTPAQTRTLLIVCHLERRAMDHIVGEVRSRVLLRQHITTGQAHPWVYAQAHVHARRLDQICTAADLWPDRLTPKPSDHQ